MQLSELMHFMSPDPDELIPTRWSLIARLKQLDDSESWREFFDTYWRLIHSVAVRAGLTAVEAEEVVQETVISVSKNIGGFRADPAAGSFKAWLLRLTRWRIVDQIRKRPRESMARRHFSPVDSDNAQTPTEERIADPQGNLLERIWEKEWEQNLVAAAMDRLQRQVQPEQFQAFYLLTIKEQPAEKVASYLDLSVANIYVIKHRLARQLDGIITNLKERPL